jgi:regulator of nucleoside diphosphate kinase
MQTHTLRPAITIGEADHQQLLALAMGGSSVAGNGDDLFAELERARVVPDRKVGADIVRMGSTVSYRPDNGHDREVTLVYPAEADIAAGKVSVLTPVGTALIGLRTGQSITWTARNGQRHVLTVLSVTQPQTEAA